MRKSQYGCLAALTLTAAAVLAPSSATADAAALANPTSPFRIEYGATWSEGTVTWNNRSVRVVGKNKSVSAASDATCRTTYVYTLKGNKDILSGGVGRPYACGNTKSYDFTVSADVRGGAAYIRVCLDDGNLRDLKCELIARPS
ncbi:hypothetical protein ABT354_23980 [Streptomyces sp. NPDC000594]|uniref:hypothetical protein n=1 Tax=Streptomyces sp. NPDC000594 TaxID=3154261 RepID=UPI00333164F7